MPSRPILLATVAVSAQDFRVLGGRVGHVPIGTAASASETRNSCSVRLGGTLFAWKTASCGLFTFFGLASRAPSCTAQYPSRSGVFTPVTCTLSSCGPVRNGSWTPPWSTDVSVLRVNQAAVVYVPAVR